MTGAALMAADKKRDDTAVKIETDIARKVRTICSYRGITIAEYLSGFLRPIIDREFEKFRKELQSDK